MEDIEDHTFRPYRQRSNFLNGQTTIIVYYHQREEDQSARLGVQWVPRNGIHRRERPILLRFIVKKDPVRIGNHIGRSEGQPSRKRPQGYR